MQGQSQGTLRYDLIFGLLILTVAGLCVRMAWLVRDGQAKALPLAERQHRMEIPLPARPGNIFARVGKRYTLLAGSKQVPYCYIDPAMIKDEQIEEVSRKVAKVLDMKASEVQELIYARRDTSFCVVKADLSEAQVQAVRAMRSRPIQVKFAWQREYPSADLAATVIGFRQRTDGTPGAGLEMTQNKYLASEEGLSVFLGDAQRRPIWEVPEESRLPRDGQHVFLCIDAAVQGFLQDALKESVDKYRAKWGSGIVVNPQTGQILAMSAYPTFDPGQYSASPPENVTNKTICVPYEPGSALKPVYAAAAVDAGVATFETMINCEGGVYNAPRGGRISDHGEKYGMLSLCDVVVHSSNIGMAKVGEMLGNQKLFDIAQRFGFGQETGIELPGESGGILRRVSKWDGYSMRRVPFGQEISTTSVQLAMAFSALSNGGLLLKPHVVDFVNDAGGQMIYHSKREIVRRVIKPEVSEQILGVMAKVVEEGTGKACRMEQWTSFGKTGTAQIPGPRGYIDGAFTGSFIGGAPVGHPEVLCVISIYWPDRSRGHYGATVAAPYVKQVLARTLSYLDVPPDKQTDSPMMAQGPLPSVAELAAAVSGDSDRDSNHKGHEEH
jgi:cell division protein FtsI (penicillin-binding protein 3)